MIGRPRPPTGGAPAILGVAVLLPAIAFGARPADAAAADPAAASARRAVLATRAEEADDALRELQRALRAAVVAARRGAALVVAGDRVPGPELEAAADRLDAALPLAERAAAAVRALRGVARAAGARGVPEALAASSPGELPAIGEQLRDSAAAGDEFAARRRETEAAVEAFGDALDAIERHRPADALMAADRAAAHLAAIAAWQRTAGLPTLPFWVDTMGALLDASRRAARATLDGDRAAAEEAVGEWRTAAGEAHRADLALGVAIAEGGSLVTAPALRRLAAALAEVVEARDAVASLVHSPTARSPTGQSP